MLDWSLVIFQYLPQKFDKNGKYGNLSHHHTPFFLCGAVVGHQLCLWIIHMTSDLTCCNLVNMTRSSSSWSECKQRYNFITICTIFRLSRVVRWHIFLHLTGGKCTKKEVNRIRCSDILLNCIFVDIMKLMCYCLLWTC